MKLPEIHWATPEGIRDTLAGRLLQCEMDKATIIAERNALARQLASRPTAEFLWGAMSARADQDGAIHRDAMLDILRLIGGHP